MKKIILALLISIPLFLHAQQGVVATGGDATGSGGTMSSSTGLTDFYEIQSEQFSLQFGLQHPYKDAEIYQLTLNLDMSLAPGFDPETDLVYVSGTFVGFWSIPGTDPDNQLMTRVDESMTWTKTFYLEAGEYEYKYFLNDGWEGGEWEAGENRQLTLADDMEVNDLWGYLEFPDIIDVSTLAELRAKPPGETIYRYTGEAVIVAMPGQSVATPFIYSDFEDNQHVTFAGFPDSPAIVENPAPSGINTSSHVAQWQRSIEPIAHAYAELDGKIDFSEQQIFRFKIWSPVACEVLFKVEDKTDYTIAFEVSQTVSDTEQWVELTFDFSGAESGMYDKIVIFMDFLSTEDNIFYFDDVTGPAYDGAEKTGSYAFKPDAGDKGPNRNRKFIQDETAAIFIFDAPGKITTNYNLYDVITHVTGTIEVLNNMVRFLPAENAPEALGNTPVEPYLLALDEVTPNDQAKLIKFTNVTFQGIGAGEVFTGGQNYTITDGVNTFVLRTMFWEEDYIGMEIPHEALDITGVVTQFHEEMQITPRFAADIEEYFEPVMHNLTLNVDMSDALNFDPDVDLVYVTGTFAGFWPVPGTDPDNQLMTRVDETMIWTKNFYLEEGEYQYKYFLNEGWDGGEWGTTVNRQLTLSDDTVVDDLWGYLDYPDVIEVSTLADLRTMPLGETIYRYIGEAVIVAMDDFQNRKYIQDETAAIFINDQPGNITTLYELYDVITHVTGQIEVVNNMVRFLPTENAPEALANTPVEPYLFTLDGVTTDDQAKLIKFSNVTFQDIEAGQVFVNAQSYTITDGNHIFVVRTHFWDVDYIGEEIPHEAVNITGVVSQFHEEMQITPRFAADIEEDSDPDPCPPPDWEPVAGMQYSMQLAAHLYLNEEVSFNPNDILGAFVDGECRGVASPDPDQNGLVFMSIGSNEISGEIVDLIIWDSENCEPCQTWQTLEFEHLAQIGDPGNPYIVECKGFLELSINLGQGFTWFSVNIDPGSMMVSDLMSGLSPCENDRIIGQTSYAIYFNGIWMGSLQEINPEDGYVMDLCSTQELYLLGAPAPSMPLNISQGYQWIGYIPQQCLPVNTALGNLVPVPEENDRLIGQTSFAMYHGGLWLGSLTNLCPGVGYVSALTHSSILQYPDESKCAISPDIPYASLMDDENHGVVSHMEHTMNIVGKLVDPEGFITHNENNLIIALSGNERRGSARPVASHDGLIFLSIASNIYEGEQIRFMAWSDELQQLIGINETLTFESLSLEGNPAVPFLFTMSEPLGVEPEGAYLPFIGEPYPNPALNRLNIPYFLNEPGEITLQLHNSYGQRVYNAALRQETRGEHNWVMEKMNLPSGVYFYKIELTSRDKTIHKSGMLVIME